jgi:DNA-directed RNA polymerase specialized sigma24 family protein
VTPEIASDSLAEALAQLLRRGDAVRDPLAWTWRAAFRIAAGELKVKHQNTHEVLEGASDVPEPLVDLFSALAGLSPRQRASVLLHHYTGYSVKDVARLLGTTAPAVKVHLSVGRRRLRQILEEASDE